MVKMTATGIAITKARGYLYRGKYPQVVVFTTEGLEADKLRNEFGGHIYQHGTGFTWVLSKKSELAEFEAKVKPWLPSCHGFESVITEASVTEVEADKAAYPAPSTE